MMEKLIGNESHNLDICWRDWWTILGLDIDGLLISISYTIYFYHYKMFSGSLLNLSSVSISLK